MLLFLRKEHTYLSALKKLSLEFKVNNFTALKCKILISSKGVTNRLLHFTFPTISG